MSGGLPFLSDLALSLSVLACTMLALLYDGPETSEEELTCQHLLRSKLLQRSVASCCVKEGRMLHAIHVGWVANIRCDPSCCRGQLPHVVSRRAECFMLSMWGGWRG